MHHPARAMEVDAKQILDLIVRRLFDRSQKAVAGVVDNDVDAVVQPMSLRALIALPSVTSSARVCSLPVASSIGALPSRVVPMTMSPSDSNASASAFPKPRDMPVINQTLLSSVIEAAFQVSGDVGARWTAVRSGEMGSAQLGRRKHDR